MAPVTRHYVTSMSLTHCHNVHIDAIMVWTSETPERCQPMRGFVSSHASRSATRLVIRDVGRIVELTDAPVKRCATPGFYIVAPHALKSQWYPPSIPLTGATERSAYPCPRPHSSKLFVAGLAPNWAGQSSLLNPGASTAVCENPSPPRLRTYRFQIRRPASLNASSSVCICTTAGSSPTGAPSRDRVFLSDQRKICSTCYSPLWRANSSAIDIPCALVYIPRRPSYRCRSMVG